MRSVSALLFVLCCATAQAAGPEPRQFAQGFAIEAPVAAPVYRVELPEAVYRGAQRADLGDLRVFNGAGEAVPHAVRRPEQPPSAQASTTLPFYPLRAGGDDTARQNLHIALEQGGAIIDLTPANAAAAPAIVAYVADSGALGATITALRLAWDAGANGFLGNVEVYSSADLAAWRLVGNAAMADLDHDGHRLTQDRVALSQPLERYLRIALPGARQDIVLKGVSAETAAAALPLARNASMVAGAPAAAPERGFLFELPRLPIDSARIVLNLDNTLVSLRWFSRAAPGAPWRDLGSQLAYRLYQDGAVLESGEMRMAENRDRYWRVLIDDGDAAALGPTPMAQFGWLADELLFMGRGAAPFQLAVGSADVGPATQSVEALLGSLRRAQRPALVASAMLGDSYVLGGAEALIPAPPPLPWQRYLLWAVLVGAVVLLGAMARQLLRQVNTPAS